MINRATYEVAYLLPNLPALQTCILMVFCRIDKDRNGRITADELQQALSNGRTNVSISDKHYFWEIGEDTQGPSWNRDQWNYCKIPKLSSRAYIFQRPFLRCLYSEGNLRFKIEWASLLFGSKFTIFALFHFVFEGNFPSTSPQGLIFGGAM